MVWRVLIIALGLCSASPAAARVQFNYGVGFGWGPAVVVPPPPNVMMVNNQYYDLSVSGLDDLCASQPFLCGSQVQRDALNALERDRAIGWTMTAIGFGLAVVGPLVASVGTCNGGNHGCQPNWAVFTSTLVGGSAIGVTGILLTPSTRDVVNFVNMTNAAHSQNPIQLRFSMMGNGSPGFVVAGGF